MNIFFTADEHHGHENARIGWGKAAQARPFGSLEEMTEGLIERHNAVVKKGDEVWHLGDMFWRTLTPVQAADIVCRLNGSHCYVLGNHEELMREHEPYRTVHKKFQEVNVRHELLIPHSTLTTASEPVPKRSNLHIVLDHYAGRVWNRCHHGSWQLHGHSHGMLPDAGLLQMDVGVDCNGFAPVSLEQVRAFMSEKAVRLPRKRCENCNYELGTGGGPGYGCPEFYVPCEYCFLKESYADRKKIIGDLRCYMSAVTVKNPLHMIDDFEAGYDGFLRLTKPLDIIDDRNDNPDYAAWKDI